MYDVVVLYVYGEVCDFEEIGGVGCGVVVVKGFYVCDEFVYGKWFCEIVVGVGI